MITAKGKGGVYYEWGVKGRGEEGEERKGCIREGRGKVKLNLTNNPAISNQYDFWSFTRCRCVCLIFMSVYLRIYVALRLYLCYFYFLCLCLVICLSVYRLLGCFFSLYVWICVCLCQDKFQTSKLKILETLSIVRWLLF